ncbi:LysR family transcriptional regulator [Motiliproteus coralliicola]|uniref:LysR family transcriptional regulator n=1 Tax=Motiliproteus coralliicola TaxID=2283196 RepID=A0A369WSZ3_9GAMM|nr:LysR family transcriptional regulator [Motiliproteus coralliicola]RDE25220.1 LysR family transcriptional regulator [Motiliproteus coralliicola]
MNTSDLNLFVRIAETGSLTETAKQLGITTAAASFALRRLEKALELQLFIRTTRQLRITPQGERFLFHCRKALDSLDLGVLSAQEMLNDVRGELRLCASSDLGRNIVLPWLDEMIGRYPSLSVDFHVGDSLSNFFLDQIDVALRYGKPQDSTLVSFHIATIDRVTCASPSYIAQHGEPQHPDELRNHNCLLYRLDGRLFDRWDYTDESGRYRVKVDSNRISNDTDIVRRWAIAGQGIAHRSRIDIQSDLRKGRLVPLLSSYHSPPVELYLLCPSRKQVTPAVIAFREMLREKCRLLLEA